MKPRPRRKAAGRPLVALALTAVVVTVGVVSWRWIDGRPCDSIAFQGMTHVDASTLSELVTPAAFIDPAAVALQVRTHPWVRASEATCSQKGVLHVSIQERVPVVSVLDKQGRPTHFIDSTGYTMPATERSAFDVPLLHGLDEPFQPLENEQVRNLVRDLAALDEETDALLSEFVVGTEGTRLYTRPLGARGAVEVWLGSDDFEQKLRRLRSFWDQAVLPEPERTLTHIDLRFEGQIVAR